MSFKHMPGKLHGTILESVSETFSRHRVIVRQDEDGWNKANNHHMTEEETPSRTVSPEPNGTATEVVDLLSESEPDEAFQADDFLSDEDIESLLQSWNEQPQLNREPSPLLRPRSTIPSARVNDIIVMPGMSVELAEGGFLRILEILQDRLDVFLRGYHFMKLNDLSAPVPRWDQEVCWIIKRDEYGDIISEKEVPLSSTLGIVQLSLTNRPRSHQTRDRQIGVRQTSIRPRLYLCRLQWLCVSHGSELIIRYLTPEEADEGYRTESYMLRKKWRGATKYFGSDMVDGQQLYSFGDGFCGAGGISCGAKAAGLNLQWSFDHDKYAMITYTKNFPDSTFHLAGFDQFMTNPSHEIQVDISHTSPPCQTWSPAHTVMSDNDDHNSALLYSSYNLIPKVKPRIHTIEQTSGLSERHQDHYHCVIRDTLELGYSVHTKVVSCQDYGIPQTRKRLVFIAAGPGERLPRFPYPTHGPGQIPFATIASTIANIPDDALDHDIAGSRFPANATKRPFDPHSAAKTVTCGGGEHNYHPSGQRRYTNREFASLQTFPLDFQFHNRNTKKQIGNAVPPKLAQVIYRAVIESLQETDARELRDEQERRQNPLIIE